MTLANWIWFLIECLHFVFTPIKRIWDIQDSFREKNLFFVNANDKSKDDVFIYSIHCNPVKSSEIRWDQGEYFTSSGTPLLLTVGPSDDNQRNIIEQSLRGRYSNQYIRFIAENRHAIFLHRDYKNSIVASTFLRKTKTEIFRRDMTLKIHIQSLGEMPDWVVYQEEAKKRQTKIQKFHSGMKESVDWKKYINHINTMFINRELAHQNALQMPLEEGVSLPFSEKPGGICGVIILQEKLNQDCYRCSIYSTGEITTILQRGSFIRFIKHEYLKQDYQFTIANIVS